MPTPKTETQVAQSETLEQIAERLMLPAIGKVAPAVWNEMVYDILSALRNERETRRGCEHCSCTCDNCAPCGPSGKDGNKDGKYQC